MEFEETNQLCDNEGNSAAGRRGLTAKQAVVLCRSVMLHTRAASLCFEAKTQAEFLPVFDRGDKIRIKIGNFRQSPS